VTEETFLTAADMARIYRIPSVTAFLQRFRRDQRKPKEQRIFPDPMCGGMGTPYLWAPGIVNAHLKGEKLNAPKSSVRR
jgi:hypothetical protein